MDPVELTDSENSEEEEESEHETDLKQAGTAPTKADDEGPVEATPTQPEPAMVETAADEEDELLVKLEDDAAYDTDLEDAPKQRPDIVNLRRGIYMKKCSQLGVPPVSRYLKRPGERKLRLSHRCLSAKEADAITYALELSPDVMDLNLRDNILETAGFNFVSCLLKDSVYLNKVNISGNRLGREGMAQLKQALLKNNSISTLDASGNEFDEHTGQDWKDILLNNDRLSQLNLSHNRLGCVGVTKVAEALCTNDAVCNLNLSWNCIRQKGAKQLAKALRLNKSLRELHVQFNGFSSEGALEVAASLMENRSLRVLDLSGNRIPKQAAGPFARMFKKNRKLRVLMLKTNPLLSEGVLKLMKVLHSEEGIALELLDIEDITVSQDLMSLYKAIRVKNPKFRIRVRTVIRRDGTVERVQDDFNTENPLEVLLMFMQEKNLRLIDLFKNLDKDQSNSISREEFVLGLRDFEVPLTEDQIDQLIETLDKDGDGEIDLVEILNINKEFRDVKRRAIHRVRQRRATVRVREAKLATSAIARLQTLAAVSSSFTEEHHSCSSESDNEDSRAREPQQQQQLASPSKPQHENLRRRSTAIRRPSTAVRVLPNIWSGTTYPLEEPRQKPKEPEQRQQVKKSPRIPQREQQPGSGPARRSAPARRRSTLPTSAAEGGETQQQQQRKWMPANMSLGKPQSKR